jgi:hypothetical protein
MSTKDMLVRVLEGVGQKYIGVLLDFGNRLRGPSRELWFGAMTRLLRDGPQVQKLPPMFTLSIDGMDPRDRIRRLEQVGRRVSAWSVKLIRGVDRWEMRDREFRISVVDPKDLIPEPGHSQQEMVETAIQRGYRIPPAYVALVLAQKYEREELKTLGFDMLTVMHEPLVGGDGKLCRLWVDPDWDEDDEDSAYVCATHADDEMPLEERGALIFLAPLQ